MMIVRVGYVLIIFCALTSALKSERHKEIEFPNDVNPNGEFVINSPGRVKRGFYGDNGWINKDWNMDGEITEDDDIPLWQQQSHWNIPLRQQFHDNNEEKRRKQRRKQRRKNRGHISHLSSNTLCPFTIT